ncbi:hypothetical protein VTH06DRAFT_678 [Thermothelomyces fergusii]
MPFGEDLFPDGDMDPPLIQSDLVNSLEAEMDRDYGEAQSAGPTIVTLADRAAADEEPARAPESSSNQQVQAEEQVEAASHEPAGPSPATQKRGRPSILASEVPACARASSGKRKTAEVEPKETEPAATPVRKRGRPARSARVSASARLAAAAAANKRARGRPRSSTTAAEKPAKRGRPARKDDDDDDAAAAADGETAADEFEVEEIVDSAIDADTMEHMYLVKWKGYPASENTWEPKKNLGGALDLVREFEAAKKKAEAEEAARKAAEKKTETATATAAPRATKATRKSKAKEVKPVKKTRKAPGRPGRPGPRRRARA